MDFLEKDLEEIIYSADRELLYEKGLPVSGMVKRQLIIGGYGIADLVTFERVLGPSNNDNYPALIVTVYELKKDKIGISAFLQAIGYAKGIKQYLKLRGFSFSIVFNIVLIGKRIDESSTFAYLPEILPCDFLVGNQFLRCYTYEYTLDGIQFNEEYGYKLISERF